MCDGVINKWLETDDVYSFLSDLVVLQTICHVFLPSRLQNSVYHEQVYIPTYECTSVSDIRPSEQWEYVLNRCNMNHRTYEIKKGMIVIEAPVDC